MQLTATGRSSTHLQGTAGSLRRGALLLPAAVAPAEQASPAATAQQATAPTQRRFKVSDASVPSAQPRPSATSTFRAAPWQQRTELLIGDGLARLAAARVLIVGLGGVGSYAAEFLARSGVGSLTLMDGDVVDVSNCNRQLHALHSTVGQPKVQLVAQRLRDVAPNARITAKHEFLLPEKATALLTTGALGQDGRLGAYDYVLDCIDSVEPKKALLAAAAVQGIPIIASMGAGGRLDASRVKVVPLSATHNDPFAANLRKGLRRRGVQLDKVPCVWSDEPVTERSLQLMPCPDSDQEGSQFKRSYHGTISFLPAQFGLLAAAHVTNVLLDGPMAVQYRKQRSGGWMEAQKREATARRQAIQASRLTARGAGGFSSGDDDDDSQGEGEEADATRSPSPGPGGGTARVAQESRGYRKARERRRNRASSLEHALDVLARREASMTASASPSPQQQEAAGWFLGVDI